MAPNAGGNRTGRVWQTALRFQGLQLEDGKNLHISSTTASAEPTRTARKWVIRTIAGGDAGEDGREDSREQEMGCRLAPRRATLPAWRSPHPMPHESEADPLRVGRGAPAAALNQEKSRVEDELPNAALNGPGGTRTSDLTLIRGAL